MRPRDIFGLRFGLWEVAVAGVKQPCVSSAFSARGGLISRLHRGARPNLSGVTQNLTVLRL